MPIYFYRFYFMIMNKSYMFRTFCFKCGIILMIFVTISES